MAIPKAPNAADLLGPFIEPLESRIAPAFAPIVELSNLDGSNGFDIPGLAVDDFLGISTSFAGDLNGDGFDDLIIGAHGADANGPIAGASYVIFGKSGGFAPRFNLQTLDGRNGFKLSGAAPYDLAGRSAAAAGDVNGDGYDDLIVGADGADPHGFFSGASYVVFGKASGFSANLNLAALNGTNGFKMSGGAFEDFTGRRVSGAGDINGDGFDDVIIGAHRADANGTDSGAGYVVFGKANGFAANVELSTLNGSNGFRLTAAAAGHALGTSVASAGDINGDGFSDVLIGAPNAGPTGLYHGSAYVVYGKATPFAANLNVSSLDGNNGFTINGTNPGDYLGTALNNAQDVNADGYDDIVIGVAGADTSLGVNSGASYVLFGKAGNFGPNVNVSALDGRNGFTIRGAGDGAGSAVSSAGDVNGDGFADVITGAQAASPHGLSSGASYVVFGKASDSIANIDLSRLNGTDGFKMNGVAEADLSGYAVGGGGDLNGDGFADVVVGAYGADPGGNRSGSAYVVFGGPPPGIQVSDGSIVEGDAGAVNLNFTATLSHASNLPVSFRYTTQSGTAIAGEDFIPSVSELVTFAVGETTTEFSISVKGDALHELNESFTVVLSAASNGSIVPGGGVGTGTILNDDSAPVVSIHDATLVEGNGGGEDLTFSVTLSAPSGRTTSVSYASMDGSAVAGSDYAAFLPQILTFMRGETARNIDVTVLSDVAIEDHETFSIVLSNPIAATIGTATATGTILNDDTALIVDAPPATLEGDSGATPFLFVVRLEKASALPVTVASATANGTAEAGADFSALPDDAQLTFAPGETSKTIAIEVMGETRIEDHETFSLTLSNAVNATITTAAAAANIINDDTSIRIAGVSGLEGNSATGPFAFEVTLEKESALPVTFSYATADATAIAGSDYVGDTAQLTFSPGETRKTINIGVIGDVDVEAHETFTLTVSNPINASIASGTATATILNDDTALRISDVSAREGDSGPTPFFFSVSLEKPSALPVTVRYSTADGMAKAGNDYEAAPATQLTFAPGETTKSIAIAVTGDAEIEAHETFYVILSGASGAVIAQSSGEGTILNDETLVQITNASVLEGRFGTKAMFFHVGLAASALPVTVNFATAEGTATPGADYTPLEPGTLEFAPGETVKTLTIEVLGDTEGEADETFRIVLADATNAVIAHGTGVGTILNDDVTIAGPRKATFTDADGEIVTIKVSKGTLKPEDFTIVRKGLGAQLALLDFSGEPEFAGTGLRISSKAPLGIAAGDGFAHVGFINATGIDLGKVKVKGDLGRIVAGDGLDPKPGLTSLSAQALGRAGLAAQLPGISVQSDIAGALGAFKLKDEMLDATLLVSGDIGAVKVIGDMRNSVLRSDGQIGAMSIGGALSAHAGGISIISARGIIAGNALAIGSITIGGGVGSAQILAGYDRGGAAVNGDASIGSVVVGGDWFVSSLAAGVRAGEDGRFGTDDDAPISPSGGIVAKIASITIKGSATGSITEGDHFGFVAEKIGAFKVARTSVALLPGPGNDVVAVGSTGDMSVREIAAIFLPRPR